MFEMAFVKDKEVAEGSCDQVQQSTSSVGDYVQA